LNHFTEGIVDSDSAPLPTVSSNHNPISRELHKNDSRISDARNREKQKQCREKFHKLIENAPSIALSEDGKKMRVGGHNFVSDDGVCWHSLT
jgi:hypothetical protein